MAVAGWANRVCKCSRPRPAGIRCGCGGAASRARGGAGREGARLWCPGTPHFSTFLAFFRMSHFFLLGRRQGRPMLGIHS